MRDFLVNLSVGKTRDISGEFAITVAQFFDAHLSAVAFAYEPPIRGSTVEGAALSLVDDWRAKRKAEAHHARREFEKRARLADITFTARVLSTQIANAPAIFSTIARNYDLSIVRQAHPDDDFRENLTIEMALFDSGRPVLIVPYIQKDGIGLDRVMVCWDGSRNAARAIGDAMPILKRSGRIDVVTVERKEQCEELRGAKIAEHLARQGLNVDLNSVVAPESDAANVILSHAADSNADLIVMGGYGHSRFREFMLGGVTRSILGSMTAPVLMSH